MKTESSDYPKVRVTKQAHAHLMKLVPAIREARGLNVSMTDLASEAILSIPLLPTPQPIEIKKKPVKKTVEKKRHRKAAVSMTTVPAAL